MRVWVPAEPESESSEPVLRGLLEQVGSGRSEPFANEESLLALLREATRARREDTAGGDR